MKLHTPLSLLGCLLPGSVLAADCPGSLPVQQLVDCIVAEGAGQSYESYLKEMKQLEQAINASRITKSPTRLEVASNPAVAQNLEME